MKRAVAYIRWSPRPKRDDSPEPLTREVQLEAIQGWCARHDAEIASVHVDEFVSGGDPVDERPALLAAIDALEEGSVLVVAKRDRLARDVYFSALVERLVERKGARIVSAAGEGDGEAGDPTSQLMRRMVDAFAEYERALIRSRTRAAMAVMRRRHEYTGGHAPYGWRVQEGGRLEPDPIERAVRDEARKLRSKGHSLRAIGAALERLGWKPRKGNVWHASSIKAVLEAEA